MLTFKQHSIDGLPAFRLFAGANCLGTIVDYGPGAGHRWRGVASDGTKFGATSRAKLAQKLQIHAAAEREAR